LKDFCQDKIPRQSNNVKHQLEKYEDINAFIKDKKSGISQIIIDVRQNAIIKQTIKENTYQMDVCLDGDQNIVVDVLRQNVVFSFKAYTFVRVIRFIKFYRRTISWRSRATDLKRA